jgi:PKD repeat protein
MHHRFLFLFLLLPFCLSAQTPVHCGTDLLSYSSGERNAASVSESAYRKWILNASSARQGTVKIIPVVFHLIQQTATVEISDGRIKQQLDVLNEDFRRMAGTPGFGNGVDTQIEFCIATIDPNGCPTTGINRIVDPANAWHDMANEAQLKNTIQWDPAKYLNIWVPKVITGGILGYARFPQTLQNNPGVDGIVLNGNFFGRGPGTPVSVYDQGRTATHEVGHYLGLHHTFNGGCSGMTVTDCDSLGDAVCDTPPTSNSNFGCPAAQNTCAEMPVDLDDQTRNYMDYTNDLCMDMLTAGQTTRMDFFLNTIRTQLWSPANLAATGCDGTISPGCIPVAQFSASLPNSCTGFTVQFQDFSNGPATSWNWSFPGGTPSTSTLDAPTVTYAAPGNYDVTLIVSNSFGTDTLVRQQYVHIAQPASVPLSESFESAPTIPTGWEIINSDNQGAWHFSNAAATEGSHAMLFDNFTDSTFALEDDLLSVPIDLSSFTNAELSFDYAYRKFNSFRFDTLLVLVSADCGVTWDTAWVASGNDLATVGGIYPSQPWVPASISEWANAQIDLSQWANSANFRIVFRNICHGGQAIWIDRININVPVGVDENSFHSMRMKIVPNPSAAAPVVIVEGSNGEPVQLELFTIDGVLVTSIAGRIENNTCNFFIQPDETDRLGNGIYFFKCSSASGQAVGRWVKME